MKRLPAVLVGCAVLFFALTAWYGRPAGLWNSPDETANAFWAERVASGESLAVRDVLVGLGAGAIHPRSMAVAGDALVPGSFAGLILLYGGLNMLTNLPLFLFTPLFTAAAGVLFGMLVGRLFDRRVGAVAGLLFFLHPAVFYYAARGLFHNVLFVDLLIMSAACFVLRKDRLGDALGGFLFGWALLTRASEAVWAVPAFALFLPFAGKERWKRLGWALAGSAIPLFLLLQTNASLYGSPFKTPYVAAPAPAAETIAPAAGMPEEARDPAFSLPFGFDAKRVLRNAWHYGLKLFWWQSALAVTGFVLWWISVRKAANVQRMYVFAALASSLWLAVLYGSWAIRDRLDFQSVTIGTSYVRYFLPAYVAMLPFAALALVRLSDVAKRRHVGIFALAVCAFLTVHVTAFAGDESLNAVRETLASNAAKREALLQEVFPPDAVVMTERFDKLLVPDILRIIPLADEAGFLAAEIAFPYAPVYWYGLAPSPEEFSRLERLAKARGFTMNALENPIAGESAYLLKRSALGLEHADE